MTRSRDLWRILVDEVALVKQNAHALDDLMYWARKRLLSRFESAYTETPKGKGKSSINRCGGVSKNDQPEASISVLRAPEEIVEVSMSDSRDNTGAEVNDCSYEVNDLVALKLLNKAGEMPSLEPSKDESIRTLCVGGLDKRIDDRISGTTSIPKVKLSP
ncbi:hypothetical protein PTKIN_Ptkin12aG0081600 [Pterospermum kingtungense]